MKVFKVSKVNLLKKYDKWLSKGNANRFVLLVNDEPAAYFAIIPTNIVLRGQNKTAIWWIDLIISKEYRGYGLQTIIDNYIQKSREVKLGFPNKLEAKIHIKHNWNVKHSLRTHLYPINIKSVIKASNLFGCSQLLSQIITILFLPINITTNYFVKRYKVKWSEKISDPSPNIFYEIFLNNKNDKLLTTWRSINHFNYRYFSSPNNKEFQFYLSKKGSVLSHYCIARIFNKNGNKVMTILDLYGDFDDWSYIIDLIKLVVKDAIKQDVVQITSLAALPRLSLIFKRCGFIFWKKTRFCILDNSSQDLKFYDYDMHWTLGDSDNDIWL